MGIDNNKNRLELSCLLFWCNRKEDLYGTNNKRIDNR